MFVSNSCVLLSPKVRSIWWEWIIKFTIADSPHSHRFSQSVDRQTAGRTADGKPWTWFAPPWGASGLTSSTHSTPLSVDTYYVGYTELFDRREHSTVVFRRLKALFYKSANGVYLQPTLSRHIIITPHIRSLRVWWLFIYYASGETIRLKTTLKIPNYIILTASL